MGKGHHYQGASGDLSWTATAISDVGRVRKVNEDRYMVNREQNHWVVADGMGGHKKGDVAAVAVCDALLKFTLPSEAEYVADKIEDTLLAVSEKLQQQALAEGGDLIGSTVAGVIQIEHCAYCYWGGDSRIYRLRDDKLEQISDDHTHRRDMQRSGNYTFEEIANHPERNMITIAVGADNEFAIGNEMHAIAPGDLYLLCSDGIDKELSDEQIAQILTQPADTLEATGQALINQVLANGARDNATLILIRFERQP